MNVIKEKRIEKGISVEEMAMLFNLTSSEYENYENNLSIMKWDLYIVIQRYLDI
ncbi:helix-turn-helix domain-containing protein [[Clostridium] innocuum]|nr:helix-turn-helix domain-containing protein [[Clostridium] innocuum]MCR0244279.1 helix-turn-helix domain-containing protein [[Clostridium] innocuum]MCR0257308.1 helix-turn-helix domain-containing protein [[Clostridium] innocuum]